MQRWFYANEELVCDHLQTAEAVFEADYIPKRSWRFCVQIKDRELLPNEAVALSGNCAELGGWQFEKCVLMTPLTEGYQDKWHVYVDIPADRVILYRYLIVAIDPDGDQMIVRFFESHLKPRKVQLQMESIADICEDVFGVVKDRVKVERGWLTTERILQLMFFNAPFSWREPALNDHIMQVKVTPAYRRSFDPCTPADEYVSKPIKLTYEDSGDKKDMVKKVATKTKLIPFPCGKVIPSFTKLNLNDCEQMFPIKENEDEKSAAAAKSDVDKKLLSNKPKVALSTAFAFNEVVNFNIEKDTLKQQPIFGTACGEKDLTLFHLTIGDFDNTVYLIEFFTYSKNAGPDENPYLVGYRYLLPEDMESASSGYIEAPIVCASTHRRLGKMCFRFLVIKPAEDLKFDLSISYLRHWDSKQTTLDIGHRGQGGTYETSEGNIIYENTIHSIQMAVDNGADMVEFDVHLTKDAFPVVYHDFNVHVSQLNPKLLQDFNSIALPLNKLSHKELLSLRLPKNVAMPPPRASDNRIGDVVEETQLFPLLLDVMEAVDEDIAYDIEIKWPQQFCNGKWQEDVRPRFDRNLYIDRILKDIMAKVGNRRVVLSCFEADMCSMLRFKQNLFPVMFLLDLESPMPYIDARSNSYSAAINFAYAMELLGIIPHAQTIMRNPGIIGECVDLNLTIFCYGVNGDEDTSVYRNMGVSAVILDRMDKLVKQDECNCPCCPTSNSEEDSLKASGDSVSFKSLESWEER